MPDEIKELVKNLREIHALATIASVEAKARLTSNFHADWVESELCAILRDMEYKILIYKPENDILRAYTNAQVLCKKLKEHEILMVLKHPYTKEFVDKF